MEGAGKSVITGDAAGELLLEIRYDARMRAGNRMTPASTGQPLLLYRVAKSDRNLGCRLCLPIQQSWRRNTYLILTKRHCHTAYHF